MNINTNVNISTVYISQSPISQLWDEASRGDREWSDVEYVLQTLIDNESLRRGLLYHMENL